MLKHTILTFSFLILACDSPDEMILEALDEEAELQANEKMTNAEMAPEAGTGVAQIQAVTLGLNYNETIDNFKPWHLNRIYGTNAKRPWTRFIFNVTKAYYLEKKPTGDWPEGKAWIEDLCDAFVNSKTVVNIRWEFKTKLKPGMSPVPMPEADCEKGDCSEFKALSNFFTTEVVPALKACTTVLVVGNEPFLEVPNTEVLPNSKFTRFYKQITLDTLASGSWETSDKPLYFGSFEALWAHHADPPDPPSNWDLAREELLNFVNNHPRLSGVDLHMHSFYVGMINSGLNWLDSRLDKAKEIIVTEFSPAPALKEDMKALLDTDFDKKVPAEFITIEPDPNSNTIPPATIEVHHPINNNGDYLDYAIAKPRPADEFREWISTLTHSKKFPHYVCSAWKEFRKRPQFHLAFQGATQGTEPPDEYNELKWPWILNPILMQITQQPEDGTVAERWHWYEDVQKILTSDTACL